MALEDVISNTFGVSDPSPHVAPVQTQEDQQLPSLNYNTQVEPISYGMHGSEYVDHLEYTNESVSGIVFAEDKVFYLDVIASASGDNMKQRDDLYTAVEDYFSIFDGKRSQPSDFNADVDEIRVGGTSDESRPDDAVRGDRLSIELDYTTYDTYTDFSSLESLTSNVTVKEFEENTDTTTKFDYTNNFSSE